MLDSKRAPSWHHSITLLLVFSSICRAALVNRTIDDSLGDSATGFKPIYNPSAGSWQDQTCSGCAIQPDRSSAFDGTWTAATYNPGLKNISITLEFTGVSIWVFFILANANEHGPTITTNTNCNFTLDGTFLGTFVHQPDMSTYALNYNAEVLCATGLSNTPHQLIISTNDVPFNVYVNFDYAMYTAVTADPSSGPYFVGTPSPSFYISSASTSSGSIPSSTSSTSSTLTPASASTSPTGASAPSSGSDSASSVSTDAASIPSNHQANHSSTSSPPSSPPPSLNIGTIVGPVLGGVALIVIIVMFFLFRRRSKSREKQVPVVQPLRAEPNPSSKEPYRDDVTTSHLPWQRSVYSESQQVLAAAPNSGELSALQGSSQPVSENSDGLVIASLLPVRRDQQAQLVGSSQNQDEIRAMRQMEINQRLQSAQHQMEKLTARQSMPPPNNGGARPATEDQEMEDMREQIRMLRGQIENLQTERQSDWAMGLSDEPPPAYAQGSW